MSRDYFMLVNRWAKIYTLTQGLTAWFALDLFRPDFNSVDSSVQRISTERKQ
jgi:hypothetical protein